MNDVAKVAELARDIRVGMLTTIDEHGRMVSRPMAQQEVEFDGDLWFFAERNSRKIAHIRTTLQAGVTLTDSSTWLSVRGAAEVSRRR